MEEAISTEIGNIASFKSNIFNAIGIFGSARIKENDDYYLQTKKRLNGVIRSSPEGLLGCLEGTIFSLKKLDQCHLRISCYIPGKPGSVPEECSATLINVLRSKL